MSVTFRFDLLEIEKRVCDLTSVQLRIPRDKITVDSRLLEDLGCDSLEFVELIFKLEEALDVTLPANSSCNVCKSLFTRSPFRLRDLAELVYLNQGSGRP